MPTLPPAQVSFVGLFTYAWLSGRAFRRPRLVICHLLRLWEPRCTVGDRSPPSVSTSPRTFSLLCRGSMSLPACSFLRISSFFKQLPPSTLYIMHVIKTPPYSPRLLLSSSVCAGLSVLGVWERRRRGVPEVASSGGHGRPRWGVVRGGVSHLPLGHHHQPDAVLLVWGGRHLQPLPDKPEANQGHAQQPADQSHLSHTGTLKKNLLKEWKPLQ